MTRRDLINRLTIGGVTILVMPVVLESCSKTPDDNTQNPPASGGTPPSANKITIDLTSPTYSALNKTGGYTIVKSVIIANLGSGTFVALSSVCTHQGCEIGYDVSTNTFPCPCHGSVFSTTGSVVNGPATTAIKSYTLTKSGDIITINL